jgi:diguanylate cyclase (GGDEF)-like protein
MLHTPVPTLKKKRSLVPNHADLQLGGGVIDARSRLRSFRLEALAQFAPLLAGAVTLSALVLAWILFGRMAIEHLVAWLLLVVASSWLMVRKLENNQLLYLRREPPRRALLEGSMLVGLVAALWATMPVAAFSSQPSEVQTVLTGALCAMICAALSIAAVPTAALLWAGTLTGGLGLALHLGGDRVSMQLLAVVLFHFCFILAVTRRHATILFGRAEQEARAEMETEANALLMREYEERGTSCLWQTDAGHVLTYATPGITTLLGRASARLIGSALPALVGGSGALGSAMLARQPFSGIEVEFGEPRERRSVAFSGTPIVDSAGGFLGFRGNCSDVTETRSSERRLRQLANLDVLTELPNRMRMRELLGEALLSARASGRPCGMLLLDLDGFKPVNDTFGHPKGDLLLKAVSERLVTEVGERGIVGRLGGDEFAIVLDDAQNRRAVADFAEHLIRRVSEPYPLDSVTIRIGLSAGGAFGPIDGDTVDDLIKKADLALYEAKAAGRGTYRQFERTMQTEAENRMKLEHDLRQALPLNQLRLYYQPLIHSQTQEVMGFEALIRWQHPVRGFVSPAEFVPLAEEVGLIHELGEWVVKTAIRDCARWRAGGIW